MPKITKTQFVYLDSDKVEIIKTLSEIFNTLPLVGSQGDVLSFLVPRNLMERNKISLKYLEELTGSELLSEADVFIFLTVLFQHKISVVGI